MLHTSQLCKRERNLLKIAFIKKSHEIPTPSLRLFASLNFSVLAMLCLGTNRRKQ